MFAVSLAINLPYIPLLESFQTHELLVYQFAATERIRELFQKWPDAASKNGKWRGKSEEGRRKVKHN
jgi:hypothetical protein